MDRRGFTIVEALLVVGFLLAVFSAFVPGLVDQYGRFRFEAASEDLVHVLRLAQSKSMMSETDDTFGVHLIPGTGGSFVLFKGADYASRDASYDEVHVLPGGLTLSDTVTDPDIVFTRIEGSTSDTGTVTVAYDRGGISHTVSINAAGVVDLQ